MGNKANKQKPGPEPDPGQSESQGSDLPSKVNSSRLLSTDPRKETLPPPLPPSLDARNEPPPNESSDPPDPPSLDARNKPPPDESSDLPDPPSLNAGSEPPPDESSDPDPPSLDAESKSNLSGSTRTEASPPSWSGRKVSRQERRRTERMKRKFKGNCILIPLT